MKTRIITAVVAIAVLLPVLIFSDTVAFPIMFSLISVLGIYELVSCVGLKKNWFVSTPLYLEAAVFPFLLRYVEEEMTGKIALAALLITVLWMFGVLIFSYGKDEQCSLHAVSVVTMGAIYILFGFNAVIAIRDGFFGRDGGQFTFLICFLGAWLTDTFAYFAGVFFGKHKLIPAVSPKKTVEGSIGGTVCCILLMVLFGAIVEWTHPEVDANLAVFALAGLLAALVSQIGDLSMSLIKRNYGVKDYGKLFPGHGGVLDRFDSVLAVSIVLMVITAFFPLLEA